MSSALARRRARSPSMAHRFVNPSIDNLPAAITINGITVLRSDPSTICYKGGDGTITEWPAWCSGPTLGITGSAPAINAGSPLFGTDDDSVKFNGIGCYTSPNSTAGNFGTNDVVIELLMRMPPSAEAKGIASKYNNTTSQGWSFFTSIVGDGRWWINFVARNGSNLITASPVIDTSSANAWYYFFLTLDMSDSAATGLRWYINNSLASAATSGTWGGENLNYEDSSFQIGSRPGLGYTNASVAFFSMYQHANWFANSGGSNAEIALVAADRWHRLRALIPWIFRGSSTPTISKTSPSFIDKYDLATANYKSYLLAPPWIGVQNSSSTRRGILVEPQRQNKILQSRTLGTTWTQVALTSITDNSGVGIDGTQNYDGIIADANDTQHGITQDVTLTAAKYCLSIPGHPGNKNWGYIFDSTVANCWAYFNYSTGVIGIKGDGCTIGVIPKKYVGDNYIPFIVFDGTAAAHTIGVYAAEADGDNDFAGDATNINLHLGDLQIEQGTYPTSRIITTTSMVTRAAATLRYSGQYNVGEGEGAFRAWIHAPSFTPDAQHTIFCASVAGAATDLLRVYIDTDGAIKFASACTAGNAGAGSVATNICTEQEIEMLFTWRKNQMNICVAGAWGTADTSVDIPAGVDRINLCCDNAGTTQLSPIELLDYKIMDKYHASFWDRGGGYTHNA